MSNEAFGDRLQPLTSPRSAERRSAAKSFRKNPDAAAGPAPLEALRKVPDGDSICKILSHVRPLEPEHFLRFWIAAAAPGWQHPDLDAFLSTCEQSTNKELQTAAALARTRKYKDWKPV